MKRNIVPRSLTALAGLTVPEVARRYRIGEDKVRGLIRRGEIIAINTAEKRSGRPRFVITPEALAAFELRRQAATPKAPKPKRRKRTTAAIDYYPD
jgi:hypothetical protein